jgi:hypothetical protein
MSIHFAPATASFHDARLGPLPDGAVAIDAATHARLLAARTAGATITAGADGRPVAVKPAAPSLDDRRARAVALVKAEAATRILAIAPLWRQLNDARDLAFSAGATRVAIEARFAAIDAVRAASDALEARIATMSVRSLGQLDIAAPSHWPA